MTSEMPERIFVCHDDDFVMRDGKGLDHDQWSQYTRTDLSEARVKKLREALETIAEGRDAGRHDGLPEAYPVHDADTMFAIARQALAETEGGKIEDVTEDT